MLESRPEILAAARSTFPSVPVSRSSPERLARTCLSFRAANRTFVVTDGKGRGLAQTGVSKFFHRGLVFMSANMADITAPFRRVRRAARVGE